MKITSSYSVEIKNFNRIFQDTVRIYRSALTFLIDIYHKEWDYLSSIAKQKERFNTAEHLVHSTKRNVAKYDFDTQFYKMPSYLRRDVINAALGAVSSYQSNLKNWEAAGKKGNPPVLQVNRYVTPVFFRDNMYLETESDTTCKLKVLHNNNWIWITVNLKKTDVAYLKKYWSHKKPSAPKLEKHHKKWFLRFAYEESVELSSIQVTDQTICSVDLGINHDAVCSIMKSDGTVLARRFINFPSEKDHLYHVLNRIKKFQRQHGPKNSGSFWAYAKRLNEELSKKIAAAIVSFANPSSMEFEFDKVKFATEYHADVIIFEYLNMKGKKSGSKKQKLHMWRKNGIQDLVEHKAHRIGVRISRVCAKYTSRLSFDGSGEVVRDLNNHSVCTFQTGKRYNCDLSASYNIGARYFTRELLKPVSVKRQSLLWTKVPEAERRTTCTLDTLRKVSDFLKVS
jgi:IS605 OrfB family transposase